MKISRRSILCASTLLLMSYGALVLFLDRWGQTDRGRSLEDPANRPHAQAIVILGAHVLSNGKPGRSLRARTLQAAKLYRQGLAQAIICTGGEGDNPPTESEAAARLLGELGVPTYAIFRESVSRSTWENVSEASKICTAKGWKKVIVVSDPYHLWRATRNFGRMGLIALPSPSPNQALPTRLYMTLREGFSVVRDAFVGHL
jgi:uncharacterized SAM-binding protein YcdF (DUF218 family)